jgi:hypothetical protein
MADFIGSLPSEGSAKIVTPLVGAKTITKVEAFRYASVTALRITFSDLTFGYVKVGANGALELGGGPQTGTGTVVVWQ